jgi:hypothetical protein
VTSQDARIAVLASANSHSHLLWAPNMAQFIDATGKLWPVAITAGLLKRLKAIEVDLAVIIQKRPGDLADPDTLGRVLWLACEPSKPERGGLTEEQFLDRLDADAIHNAIAAVLEAFVDFSHAPSTRATARKTMERALRAATQQAIQKMESAQFSPSATDSAVSSESTPTR